MIDESIEDLSFEEEEETQEDKFLTFPLDETIYGVGIQYVLEVVIWDKKIKITQVPHMSPHTKGVINLRGKVIPVIDLRIRFDLPKFEYTERSCFIVVNINDITTGLIVDTVSGVVRIPIGEIDPAPQLDPSMQNQFIAGMGKTEDKVYILLDVNKLLFEEDLEQFEQLSE